MVASSSSSVAVLLCDLSQTTGIPRASVAYFAEWGDSPKKPRYRNTYWVILTAM